MYGVSRKKKEPGTEDEGSIGVSSLPHKKHKRHKHKKHKRKREIEDGYDGSGGGSPGTSDGFKLGLKLKIKIGGQTFGEARVAETEAIEGSSDESADRVSSSQAPMDEEEAWLAALEAGRLEEVDEELRRIKDPNLMTARQRSLLESKAQKEKEDSLPVVVEENVLTEEMVQRKMLKAKKRKEQAEKKCEKDKSIQKKTIERLLKKTDAKVKGAKKVTKKNDAPKIRYIDNEKTGCSLSFPSEFDFPLKAQVATKPPSVILCGVKGCQNVKKYSCSETGLPLCSLECYKRNKSVRKEAGSTVTVT